MAINRETIKIFTSDDLERDNSHNKLLVSTEVKDLMINVFSINISVKNQEIERIRERINILELAQKTIPKIINIINNKKLGSVNIKDIFSEDVENHYGVLNECKDVLSKESDFTLLFENSKSLENFQIIKKTDYNKESAIIN